VDLSDHRDRFDVAGLPLVRAEFGIPPL
jgi:hypothetical protein